MKAIQDKAKKSEAAARASIRGLSAKRLAETWMLTNGQPNTREVTILRGWLMDEIETRMGQMNVWIELYPHLADSHMDADRDRFGTWLENESKPGGTPVNPLPYMQ